MVKKKGALRQFFKFIECPLLGDCHLFLLIFFLWVSPIHAGSIFDHDFPGLKNKISVDLRGMDIVDVLKFLAIEGDLNIMMAKGISGPVDLLIDEVTIGDVFEILLSLNDLAYEIQGNVIKVLYNDTYKITQGVDFWDQRQTVIYQLKYASAQKVGTLLGNIKSDVGKIVFDDETGMIVMVDTPDKIKEMKEVLEKSDLETVYRYLPTETRVFELKYATVEDIETKVQESLSYNIGVAKSDVRTNSIVVTDLPHQMKKIVTLIEAFDRKTREVFIEAKVVQVTLSDTHKWGVNWSKLIKQRGLNRNFDITPAVALPLSLTTVGSLNITSTSDGNLSVLLEALDNIGETKILSNPHIAVEEGKEASINVVTTQPYSETTTTTTDSATTASTEFSFVDVGVKLTVTPKINPDGFISILVSPEISSITSFYPSDADDERVPVVESSTASTTVTVKDGTTIIIAGMIKDTKTMSVNKIPKLGDVPILGKLFSNESNVIQRTETIVFLTPNIITGESAFVLERDKEKKIKGIRE